ncbi:hypothetical protein CONLIGDRAFT_667703 [Coniochaeta ligniaria NRRL 30616]|uniref:SMODS and SLOG-associating 2TM effector domain-containing protein n=1 Tax=Coniochaeta ligniaria NRRL 30616 TaxID=1408157 RepID=A0A1J7JR89_9PEZI|nr:hypothetical protein CONLIGDRAFT_667703 [Coniochaeta ligniaria NRRL 30616]
MSRHWSQQVLLGGYLVRPASIDFVPCANIAEPCNSILCRLPSTRSDILLAFRKPQFCSSASHPIDSLTCTPAHRFLLVLWLLVLAVVVLMPKSERDSDQSITIFPLERSVTLPVLNGGKSAMSGDPEKADLASSKPGSRRATAVAPDSPNPMVASQPQRRKHHVHLRQMTKAEWARVARGVGALQDDGENHTIVHPTCWYWPPKGLPQGLYRDTIMQKSKNFYQYHLLASVRWFLMISQIILGAILTALGSLSSTSGTPITLLAALNTVDAGLLALMHNSGIPERYRSNRVEFSKVEDLIMEILDTGVIEWNKSVDELLSDCFDRFQCAKASVNANMPSSYVSQESQRTKPPFPTGGPTINSPALNAPPTTHPGP